MKAHKKRARFGSALATLCPRGLHRYDGGVVEGLQWAICRSGWPWATNGYVRLPKDHPAYGRPYPELHRVPAPGGLTYGCDHDGWIGFDTGHMGDIWPRMRPCMAMAMQGAFNAIGLLLGYESADASPTHWTRRRVAREARKLAAGLVRHRKALRNMILRDKLLAKQDVN